VRSSRIGWLKEPPFHPRSQPPTPHPLCTRAMHAFCISHLAIGNAQFLAAASHQPVRVCVCACRSPRPVALVACGQVGAGRLRHGEPEQRSVPDSLLSFGHHPRPWPCCLSPPMAAHGRVSLLHPARLSSLISHFPCAGAGANAQAKLMPTLTPILIIHSHRLTRYRPISTHQHI
jgi:hypothetical protein